MIQNVMRCMRTGNMSESLTAERPGFGSTLKLNIFDMVTDHKLYE